MALVAIIYAGCLAAGIFFADAGWLPRFTENLHDLPYCDKLVHFLMFGLLALSINLAIVARHRRPAIGSILLSSIIVLIVATAEEYSNQFVLRRGYSLGDLAANYLGVVCLGALPPVFWRWQSAGRVGVASVDCEVASPPSALNDSLVPPPTA